MTSTVQRHPVSHTQYERERIIDEGLRLDRAGELGGLLPGFDLAQKVLPEERRRPPITSITKIRWFVDAVNAARNASGAPQSAEPVAPATPGAAEDDDAPQGGPGDGKRIRWNTQEQQALCTEAARLITEMKAGGKREALILAQQVLPKHRRRTIYSMSSVATWYPQGFQAAIAKLREAPSAAAVAELAKVNEDIAAMGGEAAQTTEKSQPMEPEVATSKPEPEEEYSELPHLLAPAMPANIVTPLPSSGEDLASHLIGLWKGVRERLVQEVSNVFVEGIHRGIQRITLAQPGADATPTTVTAVPDPIRTAFPGAPAHKKGSPKQSVLIVGLKSDQPDHIRAAFSEKLDLRFCSPDESKDQLRSMTGAADVTVAVVDAISHSHMDVIKARSPRFIRSPGGITHLKHELARLSETNLNGQAHA